MENAIRNITWFEPFDNRCFRWFFDTKRCPNGTHLASGRLYMQALEFRDKKALRNEILGDKDGRELVKAQNYASFRTAVDILKKHPFDRSAFENLLDKQADFTQSRRGSARESLITLSKNDEAEEYALRLKT